MKVASLGGIIYCLIGIAAPAQTVEEQQLADFAREERQRREARGVAAEGVVTSENVRRGLGLRGFIGRVGMVVPGAPSEAAQSGATDAGEAPEPGVEADAGVSDDPLEALRRQQQVVQALQAEDAPRAGVNRHHVVRHLGQVHDAVDHQRRALVLLE